MPKDPHYVPPERDPNRPGPHIVAEIMPLEGQLKADMSRVSTCVVTNQERVGDGQCAFTPGLLHRRGGILTRHAARAGARALHIEPKNLRIRVTASTPARAPSSLAMRKRCVTRFTQNCRSTVRSRPNVLPNSLPWPKRPALLWLPCVTRRPWPLRRPSMASPSTRDDRLWLSKNASREQDLACHGCLVPWRGAASSAVVRHALTIC